jgi:hypothetical protein
VVRAPSLDLLFLIKVTVLEPIKTWQYCPIPQPRFIHEWSFYPKMPGHHRNTIRMRCLKRTIFWAIKLSNDKLSYQYSGQTKILTAQTNVMQESPII